MGGNKKIWSNFLLLEIIADRCIGVFPCTFIHLWFVSISIAKAKKYNKKRNNKEVRSDFVQRV